MPTVTIKEAQKKLSELIHRLTPGEEVVITENDQARRSTGRHRTPAAQAPPTGHAPGDRPLYGPRFRRPA